MKDFLETAVGAIAIAGFLWQIVKGYQAVHEAIDKKNDLLECQLLDLEKKFLIHEVECNESLKRIEQSINALQVSLTPKTRS